MTNHSHIHKIHLKPWKDTDSELRTNIDWKQLEEGKRQDLAAEIFGSSEDEDDDSEGFQFELPENIVRIDQGQPAPMRDVGLINDERE